MKKILTLSLFAGLMFTASAQDAADKKVMAGLSLGGAINLNDPQTNTMDANVGGDFVVGMALDWNFSKNIALSTGLEFDFNRFKTTFKDNVYFDYNDKDIRQFKDYNSESTEDNFFFVNERKHKSIYLSIPVMLKFQTNYMGYMRYYGKFGLRNSFLLTTRTNNTGNAYDSNGTSLDQTELDDMKSPGVMSFYKGAIGISGGAEYNISGNTVLVVELGYYYGFSEVFQQEGSLFGDDEKGLSLYNINASNGRDYYAPSLNQSQLLLKVSVLF
ncbi:outer membrane beta-barrel protein [Brumimicrobium aurantiacum]|uniref:PorT family protein n=1 Tax=Brumimicrobium aurantiacum TaxID=1737063 RepID=A0A3E1EV39_9FLAO|nr:outer membrane beta-barrel protein [Brumimicrobium aurantiacum]RFC53429.1 PorT family protein [Brumimicrobium aurantiacum]